MLKGEKVKPEDAKTVSPELHDTITAAVAGAGMSMSIFIYMYTKIRVDAVCMNRLIGGGR